MPREVDRLTFSRRAVSAYFRVAPRESRGTRTLARPFTRTRVTCKAGECRPGTLGVIVSRQGQSSVREQPCGKRGERIRLAKYAGQIPFRSNTRIRGCPVGEAEARTFSYFSGRPPDKSRPRIPYDGFFISNILIIKRESDKKENRSEIEGGIRFRGRAFFGREIRLKRSYSFRLIFKSSPIFHLLFISIFLSGT